MSHLLASLLVITLTLGVVVGGVTFASFTSTDSDSGSVMAGTVDIRLNNQEGVDEIVWDFGCVRDNMAPGDLCEADLDVTNDGSLAIYYEIVDLGTACFDVSHAAPSDNTVGDDGINAGHLAVGESETFHGSVELSGDPSCEAASASVGFQVNGSTSPFPP